MYGSYPKAGHRDFVFRTMRNFKLILRLIKYLIRYWMNSENYSSVMLEWS